MSLQTDSVFIKAISKDSGIMEVIESRVYGTAIPVPDAELDNVPVPYIIVSLDSMTNSTDSKDNDEFEGSEDSVVVSVEVTAETLEALHGLVQAVRQAVRKTLSDPESEDVDECPLDYNLTAGAISYDSMKPCYWQVLSYQCTTKNL